MKVQCSLCGKKIYKLTAEKNDGVCLFCVKQTVEENTGFWCFVQIITFPLRGTLFLLDSMFYKFYCRRNEERVCEVHGCEFVFGDGKEPDHFPELSYDEPFFDVYNKEKYDFPHHRTRYMTILGEFTAGYYCKECFARFNYFAEKYMDRPELEEETESQ